MAELKCKVKLLPVTKQPFFNGTFYRHLTVLFSSNFST